jgi:molybdopterin molybdotransferase
LAEYGAATIFHKVAQKPGKPLLFAKRGEQLFFGLPGNPVASNFCFNRYVAAALRKKLGRQARFPPGLGRLVRDFNAASDRVLFISSHVTLEGACWKVDCLANQGSADIYSIVSANAYAAFAPGDQRRAGDLVTFEPMVQLL